MLCIIIESTFISHRESSYEIAFIVRTSLCRYLIKYNADLYGAAFVWICIELFPFIPVQLITITIEFTSICNNLNVCIPAQP